MPARPKLLLAHPSTGEILEHPVFEMALAMSEVETAVALAKSAAKSGSDLMKAQSRAWAAEIALSVPTRLVKVFQGSDLLDEVKSKELMVTAGLLNSIVKFDPDSDTPVPGGDGGDAGGGAARKSYKDVKHYKRRKRWLS